MPDNPRLRLDGPTDLLAAVPYLLGYHPHDSLVCLCRNGGRMTFIVRADLFDTETPADQAAAATAQYLRQRATSVVLIGYGAAEPVQRTADGFTTAMHDAGVTVDMTLRATEDRYFCLNCTAPCPADGAAYDPATSTVPATMTLLGIAPLPSRGALAATIGPLDGPRYRRMLTATQVAARRLSDELQHHTAAPPEPAGDGSPPLAEHAERRRRASLRLGLAALGHALSVTERGRTLTDDEVARLTLTLVDVRVRDAALMACDGSPAQRRLWTDVTRRAVDALAAPPACLLALTAAITRDTTFANIAVERALQADAGYLFAQLIGKALRRGIPLHMWRPSMSDPD